MTISATHHNLASTAVSANKPVLTADSVSKAGAQTTSAAKVPDSTSVSLSGAGLEAARTNGQSLNAAADVPQTYGPTKTKI